MDHSERVDALARELDALHVAVAAGPVTAPVPTCPDWTVADLVEHVGGFCGFWNHVLCEGLGRDKTPYPDPPAAAERAAWLVALGEDLVALLRDTSAATPMWTWFEPDQTAGFVGRRAVNELAVHRYDAQSAREACTPLSPAVAADGIGEVFEALITRRKRTGRPTQTMHIHGTDEGIAAEWLVTMHPDRIDTEPVHAKGELALRGATSDLALLLYNRPTLAPVDRFGDESVLTRWYDEFVF